jgi:transcriptional regulator with XRE-family HTH domain
MAQRDTGSDFGVEQLADLGTRVEKRRREAGKSAREIALATGISPVYLRVIETGRNSKTGRASRPSAEVLVRLAQTLDMEADDLLMLAGYGLRAEHKDAAPHTMDARSRLAPGIAGIADALDLAQTRPSDFMQELVASELARFQAHLAAIASGSFACGPIDERRIRRLALLDACHDTLHAVSFDDDAWWLGPDGTSYIALHAQLASSKEAPAMTRIFLLAPEDQGNYRVVLQQHADAGVDVFVADPIDVPDVWRRDFEIYDSVVLREATSSGRTEAGRHAEFTDDHARLQRAESAFAAIRHVAAPFPLVAQ